MSVPTLTLFQTNVLNGTTTLASFVYNFARLTAAPPPIYCNCCSKRCVHLGQLSLFPILRSNAPYSSLGIRFSTPRHQCALLHY